MTRDQAEAIEELAHKSLHQIQIDTARKWAFRAWAAASLAKSATGAEKAQWLHEAGEYEHEALEHAALTKRDDILRTVRRIISTGD